MKKIKNKFIIIIITTLVLVIGIIFSQNMTDEGKISSVVLRNGEAEINREKTIIPLNVTTHYDLLTGDIIKTLTEESLLIVTWGDGSITRLGGNSEIKINSSMVRTDLSEIKISFNLITGKTWSNVTSFFGEESYFVETFNDHEAAVRGTIFDVDLEKDLIYVTSHAVDLKNNDGKTITVPENAPFSINKFTFISLLDYIKNYKNQAWLDINKDLDKIKFDDLTNLMLEKLENTEAFIQLDKIIDKTDITTYIEELDLDDKNKIYKKLLEEYQAIHFANADTPELLTKKLEIKEILILMANEENQKYLIESTIYDISEVIKTNNPLQFQKLLDIFTENKNILDSLDIKISEILTLKELSDELTLVIHGELDSLKEVYDEIDFVELKKLSEDKIKKILNSSDAAIQKYLNGNINSSYITDMIKNFGGAKNTLNNILNK